MRIEIADDLLQGIDLDQQQLLLELALGLFAADKATLAQAARLAGLSRSEFLNCLGQRKIPVHYGIEDAEADIELVNRLKQKVVADSVS